MLCLLALSLRINRASYFSLTLSKKYTLYIITDLIHYPLKKRRIYSRIEQFLLFFAENYKLRFIERHPIRILVAFLVSCGISKLYTYLKHYDCAF